MDQSLAVIGSPSRSSSCSNRTSEPPCSEPRNALGEPWPAASLAACCFGSSWEPGKFTVVLAEAVQTNRQYLRALAEFFGDTKPRSGVLLAAKRRRPQPNTRPRWSPITSASCARSLRWRWTWERARVWITFPAGWPLMKSVAPWTAWPLPFRSKRGPSPLHGLLFPGRLDLDSPGQKHRGNPAR